MGSQALRNRYVTDAVQTVSPAKLITMLYDAMLHDLFQAEKALVSKDYAEVNERLCHAQEIVLELQASLDPSKWEGARRLSEVYDFLHDHLVSANVQKDADRIVKCRELIEPLQSAWHQVAGSTSGGE